MSASSVKLVVPPPPADDALRMLSAWSWCLPARIAPVATNRFGDWYIATPDGAIHMLSIWEGDFAQVATSHDAWRAWLASDDGMAANWCDLVLLLYDRGQVLAEGKCFAFVPPPLDGVPIDPARIQPILLGAITSIMGRTHQQRAGRRAP